MIDDKNDNEHLRQAMTQEQLKRVQAETQKKKGSKLKIAYHVASRLGSAIQKLWQSISMTLELIEMDL